MRKHGKERGKQMSIEREQIKKTPEDEKREIRKVLMNSLRQVVLNEICQKKQKQGKWKKN